MATQFGGEGTGRLMALQYLQKKEADDREFTLRKMQSYDQSRLNEQKIKEDEQQYEIQKFEFAQKKKLAEDAKREASILSQAFSGSSGDRVGTNKANAETSLASTYRKMASELMGTNPVAAQRYLEKALEYDKSAAVVEKSNLETTQLKRKARSDSLATVSNENEFQEARAYSAGIGMPIPEQFKTYDASAKEWIKNNRIFSDAATKADNAALDVKKQKLDEQKEERIALDAKTTAANKQAEETRKQNQVKGLSKQEHSSQLKYLRKTNEAFDDLPTATQGLVAEHIGKRTEQLINTGKDPATANVIATEEIMSRVTPEGTYKPEATAPTKPDETSWIASAKKANPNTSLEELKAYYKQKYGEK